MVWLKRLKYLIYLVWKFNTNMFDVIVIAYMPYNNDIVNNNVTTLRTVYFLFTFNKRWWKSQQMVCSFYMFCVILKFDSWWFSWTIYLGASIITFWPPPESCSKLYWPLLFQLSESPTHPLTNTCMVTYFYSVKICPWSGIGCIREFELIYSPRLIIAYCICSQKV